jgi:transposase
MSKPYSLDLRARIIKCFELKIPHKQIAEKLDVSLSTIRRYSVKYKATGNLNIQKKVKTGRPEKIKDLEKLKEFVKENNHLSIIDMTKKIGNVSKSVLHRAIKRAGLSFKKGHGFIEKEMKN